MRVSKFLAGSLFLAALTVGFASCKNKDKEPDDPFNNGGNNNTPGQTDDTTAKGDGTEADPYNVQALLDMKTDGTLPEKDAGTEKKWVEGYIVGSYVFDNDPKFVIGANPTVKDNVLIADDANTTDTYAVSALKLGNYSTVVSLLNVPGNLKKKIKVYGVIEKYCGISGVVSLEQVYIDETVVELPGNTDVEVNDNMTPSEAHAAAASLQAGAVSSNKAGVTGYVSYIKEYSSKYDNITFYMSDNQDTQETFYVYRMKGGSALKVGDKIKVTGNLTNYQGTFPQMNQGATYELLESVGGGSGEGEGGGSGEGEGEGDSSEYSIDLTYTLGGTSDDKGKATINGNADITVLKIGSSKNTGSIDFTIPAGTTSVSYYAVAWTGKVTTITFSIGGTIVGEQAISGNAGATGSSPYTMTVTAADKYTFNIGTSLTEDTVVTVTTKDAAEKRAIIFGVKAN